MTYLILAKSELLFFHSGRGEAVIHVLEASTKEEARRKAKELFDANIKGFPDLKVRIFGGEFLPQESDWDLINLEKL